MHQVLTGSRKPTISSESGRIVMAVPYEINIWPSG
jgi:hypothetical protein